VYGENVVGTMKGDKADPVRQSWVAKAKSKGDLRRPGRSRLLIYYEWAPQERRRCGRRGALRRSVTNPSIRMDITLTAARRQVQNCLRSCGAHSHGCWDLQSIFLCHSKTRRTQCSLPTMAAPLTGGLHGQEANCTRHKL
jgi:hypothetical protein